MDERVTRVRAILGLRRMPIGIGFLEAPPAPLARWAGGPVAAGCVFWDRAMEGKSFYTLPADHWNCALGTHTHRIKLPAERAAELGATVSFMVETRYLDPSEVARIPALDREPGSIAYAPAGSNAFPADVVLMAVNAAQTHSDLRGGAPGRNCPRSGRGGQSPELRGASGSGQDGPRRAVLRLSRQPHVHGARARTRCTWRCRDGAGTISPTAWSRCSGPT